MVRVSANASNPTSTPILFDRGSFFTAYSPQRILYGHNEGGPNVWVNFAVPGSSVNAGVSAFGAVCTDVNVANVSSLSFADADFRSLGTFFVPPASGHRTVSFLGLGRR